MKQTQEFWRSDWIPDQQLVTCVLPFPGGSTRHEHQADGPDQKETGVHSSPPIKQICPRCLLVT